uniref:RING-type domain-containing protein n=1 Tax=Glossina brevipalpis TaxID=37001 RepID=A0A1A9W485_9MUSC
MSTDTTLAPAVRCSICKENFKGDDELNLLGCGHVFHHLCIQDCRTRSAECPECHVEYQSTQKLFVDFDDARADTMQQLQSKLENKEIDFMDLQAQYTTAKKEIDELNVKMSIILENEKKSLDLRIQNMALSQDYSHSKDQHRCLSLQFEAQAKEIALLKKKIEGMEMTGSVLLLEHKAKVLEQKLDHVGEALKKEIFNSTQLSIDNMKLQSLFDQCSAGKIGPSGGETTGNSADKKMPNLGQKQRPKKNDGKMQVKGK